MAPQVGLEPTTLRLTAGCSAIELLRSVAQERPRETAPYLSGKSYHLVPVLETSSRLACIVLLANSSVETRRVTRQAKRPPRALVRGTRLPTQARHSSPNGLLELFRHRLLGTLLSTSFYTAE